MRIDNMSRRYFKLTNFRNIGLHGNTDNIIVINNCLERGKMGGLVELIGANNSGKSNVLDAILEYGNNTLSDRDVTTLSFNEADRCPEIALVYQNDDGVIERVLNKNGKKEIYNVKGETKKKLADNEIINTLSYLIQTYRNYGWGDGGAVSLLNNIKAEGAVSEQSYNTFENIIKNLENNSRNNSNYRNIYRSVPETVKNFFVSNFKGDTYIKEKYKYSYEPKIIKYEEVKIGSNDMNVEINNLANNLFFKSLFTAIGIDSNEIINGYAQYNKFKNPASLNKIRKMIDKKIGKLNSQFNKLYFAENDEYKFTIEIESQRISFGMARGADEDPIMIEMQSTGFRWFFDLYFNFICSNKLNPGDIIVMDEPATNLHPKGQQELRRFIKEFAINNDLTFIIATHSPFLIDPDNYDELRLVSMENNRSSIDNLFSAVNLDDPDSLVPIKEALTIQQNVLYDMDTEVIWVEGITDYNYCTMFKKLLNVSNVHFIPYNGNGKTNADTNNVLSKLIGIKFYRRGILVDSDKAGKNMAALCEKSIFKDRTYKISDINSNFVEIEDLFSDEDKKKYDSLNKKSDLYKKAFYSSVMKNTLKLSDFSDETINNFKELFKLITD
jgi:predicted ATP-dependent endonuclease of OLD family